VEYFNDILFVLTLVFLVSSASARTSIIARILVHGDATW